MFRQPERNGGMTTQPAFDPINHKQPTTIVAIVTFQLPKATTAEEMSAPFQAAAPKMPSASAIATAKPTIVSCWVRSSSCQRGRCFRSRTGLFRNDISCSVASQRALK